MQFFFQKDISIIQTWQNFLKTGRTFGQIPWKFLQDRIWQILSDGWIYNIFGGPGNYIPVPIYTRSNPPTPIIYLCLKSPHAMAIWQLNMLFTHPVFNKAFNFLDICMKLIAIIRANNSMHTGSHQCASSIPQAIPVFHIKFNIHLLYGSSLHMASPVWEGSAYWICHLLILCKTYYRSEKILRYWK